MIGVLLMFVLNVIKLCTFLRSLNIIIFTGTVSLRIQVMYFYQNIKIYDTWYININEVSKFYFKIEEVETNIKHH